MQLNVAPNQDQRQFPIVWGFMYFISSTFYEMSPKTMPDLISHGKNLPSLLNLSGYLSPWEQSDCNRLRLQCIGYQSQNFKYLPGSGMRFFLKRYKLSLLNLGFYYFIFNEPPENNCCPWILCMIIISLFLSLRSGVSGTIEDGGNNIMKVKNGIQVISQWNGNCNCNSIHSLNASHSKRFPNPSVSHLI